MTQEQHPITPPPELVQKWITEGHYQDYCSTIAYTINQAARWGADQELEACCEWLHWQNLATHPDLIPSLRAARRPKPPSLKEKASQIVDCLIEGDCLNDEDALTLRRALEALPD